MKPGALDAPQDNERRVWRRWEEPAEAGSHDRGLLGATGRAGLADLKARLCEGRPKVGIDW